MAFGINEDWHVHTDALGYAAATGANLIRFPVGWQYVQPDGPETWDWTTFDRIYAEASIRGIRLIFAPSDTPCWAHPSLGCPGPPGGRPPDPEFLGHWAEFLRRAAVRYPNLAAIEVWNEPNAKPFWATEPNPEYYAQILRASNHAVKSVRPRLPVLFGGLQPVVSTQPGQVAFREFLMRAYRAGARGQFDGLSFHPYPFSRPDYLRTIRRLIASVQSVGKGRRERLPVWVTEVGVSTGGAGTLSEATQGRRLRTIYRTLRRVPGVRAVVFHRMFDQPAGEAGRGWGLVRSDRRTPKPAWCLIARMRDRPCIPPSL